MRRCIELAKQGAGHVAPNPMVGAVLVHEGRIIGEGYHRQYGDAHAEVNCVDNVQPKDIPYICKSILYVSLEPCAHFGKTPPCADLIIRHRIPHVVIGCSDSFEKVNGSGMQKLLSAGIKTEIGILKEECRALNKRFFTFHEKERPYIILKWAQTANGKTAADGGMTVKISNGTTNKTVHKWRTEEAAIFAGTNTVIQDDPALTARHWPGKNPVRVVVDNELRILSHAKIFREDAQTVIINRQKNEQAGHLLFWKVTDGESFEVAFARCLRELQLTSVLIEGGGKILQVFIDAGLWDEARVITNSTLQIPGGVLAPILNREVSTGTEWIFDDRIDFYKKETNEFLYYD